jgi:hypothetical protein
MTQIADSPRAHKLQAYGHGIPEIFQQADALVHGLSTFRGEPSSLPPSDGPIVLEPGALKHDSIDAGDGGELLAAVWRTSSYAESVQWELDAAQGALLRAVRQAALSGVEHDELCKAANMTAGELSAALQELPPPGPAL